MNYPVWDLPGMGSGLVVAVIAIIHVLISHTAIGGGAVLVGGELWARRRPAQAEQIRAWLHKFTLYFLLTTTTVGALTGVGIWFAIQLANPEGTSLLIHQFMLLWATEWGVFFAELTVLFFYYYGMGRSSDRMQLLLAVAYLAISWQSLFIINGILTFMLTPGGWTLGNRDLVAAFFNPGFWPSLLTRTLFMLMLGGLFGIFISSTLKDPDFKEQTLRFSARWTLPAAVLLPFSFYWYWTILPASAQKLTLDGLVGLSGGRMEMLGRSLLLGLAGVGLVIAGVVVVFLRPRAVGRVAALALILVAQLSIAGNEFYREMARKPYVIRDTLYSNGLWKHQAANPAFLGRSYLDNTRWHPEVEPLTLRHGEWVFRLQCASCHTRTGYRSLTWRTRSWTPDHGFRWLGTMHELGVMPPFAGDDRDRASLVAYLLWLRGLHVDPRAVWKVGTAPPPAPTPRQAAPPQGGRPAAGAPLGPPARPASSGAKEAAR